MSHVVVGERLAERAPEIIGHVIAGGGHFLQVADGLVQQFSQTGNVISTIANRGINDLSNAVALENWQWDNLNNRYGTNFGQTIFLAGANTESTAYEKFCADTIRDHAIKLGQETAIFTGQIMAGDLQGAVESGAAAAQTYWEGILRDFGWNGGWGSGPTPGQGTCPLPGEGRP